MTCKQQTTKTATKYRTFATTVKSAKGLDDFLCSIDSKYEIISVVQPTDTHSSDGWQFLAITKYTETVEE